MPRSKRSLTIDDPDDGLPDLATPLPPKKPARLSTKFGLTAASPTTVSILHGDEHHGSFDSGNSGRSSEKNLSNRALVQEVLKIVENEDKAELMVLELMRKYSFNFSRLKDLLRQNNLEVSFSKVQYADIAPMVGLEPVVQGDDIPTFDMFCARLPNHIFNQTVEDLRLFSAQYGPMGKHQNEEARARYLSGYFNRIVALFSGLLFNTPETILEGRITTKGRIEYQFKTYGGITVVFIEVKLDIGSLQERLNCFAQVIAECDACAWVNYQNGFHVPIMAILCDGKQFYFFKFIDRHRVHVSPQFFWGKFANGDRTVNIDDIELNPGTDPRTFVRQIRKTCESLYYVFLTGYQSGLEAYWKRSVERGKAQGKGRESTPGWHRATIHAKEALDEALSAWNQIDQGNLAESKKSAERAIQLLAESIEEAPFERYRFLPSYTEEMADEL